MASKFKKYSVACATMAGIGSSLVMSSSAFTGTGSAIIVSSDVFASPYNAHNYVRSTSDVLNDIFEVFWDKGYIKVVDDESKLKAKFKFEDQAASAFVPQKVVNTSFLSGEKVDISLLGYLLNYGQFLTGFEYDKYIEGVAELFHKALDSGLNNSMLYDVFIKGTEAVGIVACLFAVWGVTYLHYDGKVKELSDKCNRFDNILALADHNAALKLEEQKKKHLLTEGTFSGDGNLKKESKNVIQRAFGFFINGLFNRSNSEQTSKASGEGVE